MVKSSVLGSLFNAEVWFLENRKQYGGKPIAERCLQLMHEQVGETSLGSVLQLIKWHKKVMINLHFVTILSFSGKWFLWFHCIDWGLLCWAVALGYAAVEQFDSGSRWKLLQVSPQISHYAYSVFQIGPEALLYRFYSSFGWLNYVLSGNQTEIFTWLIWKNISDTTQCLWMSWCPMLSFRVEYSRRHVKCLMDKWIVAYVHRDSSVPF